MSAYSQSADGSITPTGALSSVLSHTPIAYSQSCGGTVTPAATLGVVWSHTPTASSKDVDGSMTPTGALTRLKASILSLTGTITPVGDFTLAKATPEYAGVITPEGDLAVLYGKNFDGEVTPEGVLEVGGNFNGHVTPLGTLEIGRMFDGTVTPEGDLTVEVIGLFEGFLTPTGTLEVVAVRPRSFYGAVTPEGSLSIRTSDLWSGEVTPVGTLRITRFKSWSLAAMHDLIIEQGAGLTRFYRYYDSTGTAVDITSYSIRMSIKTTYDGTLIASSEGVSPTIAIDHTAGVPSGFSIVIEPEDTEDMDFVSAMYDIELYKEGEVIRLVQGAVRFSREVTADA